MVATRCRLHPGKLGMNAGITLILAKLGSPGRAREAGIFHGAYRLLYLRYQSRLRVEKGGREGGASLTLISPPVNRIQLD